MNDGELTFTSVEVDPAETKKVTLSLFRWCANFWRANEAYELLDFIRPIKANGFAYECTTPGTSGSVEPIWPRTLGSTCADGSVVWTCRAASTNGLNAITNPSAVSEPTGLSISSVSVSESTKILASYSGGALGQDFDAVFTFTLNGVSRVARQRVKVRKQ